MNNTKEYPKLEPIPGVNLSNTDAFKSLLFFFISFKSLSDLSSFKYIFENHSIPKLKEGKYITVENGKIVEKTDRMNELKENKFI